MNPQWEAAIEMVKAGFYVFPLADFGKMPRKVWISGKRNEQLVPEAIELGLVDDENRSTFYIATNDLNKVYMWAERIPDANYAIACGPKFGVTVIDLDRHNETQDGVDVVLNVWREQQDFEWPFYVETPSNGLHLYYKPFKAPTRTVVSGVECQNRNSYVVGPFSRTLKGMYIPHGEYTQLVDPPEWLRKAVCSDHALNIDSPLKLSISNFIMPGCLGGMEEIPVPEGFRHSAVYKEAYMMVFQGWTDDESFIELREMVDKYVADPQKFSDDELERNIKNARRYMEGKKRQEEKANSYYKDGSKYQPTRSSITFRELAESF